jgi:hypothetical protein
MAQHWWEVTVSACIEGRFAILYQPLGKFTGRWWSFHATSREPLSTRIPRPSLSLYWQTSLAVSIPKKPSGYYLITVLILKSLSPIGIKYLTQLFNSALFLGYFPAHWKVAQIILLLKPGKPPHELTSYRPISLLPAVSKVFEKLLIQCILPLVASNSLIPDHQFGFRRRHSTIDQTHRLVQRIHTALDFKQYFAAFLDISQAFDKVWHAGLLYKLRHALSLNYFLLLKSYLHNRHSRVKVGNDYSELTSIHAGVPQGSILGPPLYLLYTADLPTSPRTLIATFAEDT